MASQPRKRTRHSTSSSDSDSDTPQLELGNITADVSEDQLQSPLIPPNLLLNLGNTSSTPLEVGKLAAVAVEPVAAAVTSGLTGGLSTDSATPILMSAVPNIMSANVTGSNAPTQVSLQFSEPSPGVSTGAHSQSQTSLGLLVEPGNEPSLSSSNIPTNVTPSLQPEADLCGVLQHDVMQSLSALNAEFHKMSVELVTSDIHDREGSDYGGDDNRCFATTSPEISDSESDLDECADTPTDNSFEPGTLPAVTNKLYTGAPITILESFVSILSFAQSENLSGVGFVKLLKLIDLHCPKPNYCCRSYSELLRYFENVKTPLESHFYCNKCHRELTSLTDICQTCRDLKHSVDQVITLSIKDQLAQLYSRPGFLQDIEYRFNRKKINANNYEDLYDGLVYKKEANEGVLKDKQNVSIMWNGDGASPFGSSNLQIWPCFGVVNELPPNKRFKHENLLLFAIFIGQGKPTPNIFLKHVYPQVEVLKQGFHVMPAGYKESIIVKAVWLCGTCDSPAKALLFNQKYHNGFYACPKCLNKGEKSERTGNVFVHPYDAEDVLRTDMGYEEDAVLAAVTNAGRPKTSRIDSNGIKGTSFLHLMVSSMIESTSIDAMHCLYLGVTKQLLELWFSKKHRDEDFSLYNVQHVVNNRLLSINPPNFVKRMPRSLSELSKWKAYEFMLMLYYYLLPALSGIMGQIYFHNFKLFVSGVSLLDLDSISDQDVDNSKELLNQFVKDFQELYGMRNMSFNVHLVSHLWLVVKLLGPLWCTSCFRFEDFNGKLLCLIHGTRFVGSQIVSNLFSFLQLPQMVHCMETGEAKEFCIALLKKGKRVKIMECIKENYFTVGNYSKPTPVPEWMLNALQAFQFLSVFTFDRVKVNGMLITSENYRKSKTCSYYVRYTFQNEMLHGSVKTFVKLTMCQCEKACHCKGDFFAFVLQHNANDCFETANPPSSPKYVKKCVESQTLNIVPVSSIFNVCVYINMDNTMFLCDPLNFMEMYN